MKFILSAFLLLNSIICFGQNTDVRAKRILADQSFFLRDRWIDTLKNDTANISNAQRSVLTAKASYDLYRANWHTDGNAGTDSLVNFIGTRDKKPLEFRVNNVRAGTIGTLSTTPVLEGIFVSNVQLGYMAGPANQVPRGNVAIGTRALSVYAQTGQNLAAGNVAVGVEALRDMIGGGNEANSALGFRALARTTTGIRNTAMGLNAGHNNTTAAFGVFLGAFAGEWQSTGQANHALGFGALRNNTIGIANTGVGPVALENQTGQIRVINPVAPGSGYTFANVTVTPYDAQPFGFLGQAQQCLATAIISGGQVIGYTITQIGRNYSSAIVTITGDGTGATATAVISSPNFNVAVGGNSGWGNQIGTDNVFIGVYSGYDGGGDQSSTIDNNMTFLGNYSSRDASVATTTALSNATAIGYKSKVGKSNALVLGGIGANRVDVGIGVVNPVSTLHVSRTIATNVDDTASGLKLSNPNAATAGISNRSPSIQFTAFGWRTTGTASTHAYAQEYFSTFSGGASPSGRLTWEVTLPQTALTSRLEFVSGADLRVNTPTSGTILPRVSLYDGSTNVLVGQWYNNVGAAGRMGIYNGVNNGFIGFETVAGDGQQIRGFANSSGIGSAYAIYAGVGAATPSAILEGTSTTRGFLMPRMTAVQRLAISSPATGLQVIDLDSASRVATWNGTAWKFEAFTTDLPILATGTYTPTLTGVANVASSTAYALQYYRIGNMVTVSGKIDVTPTTETGQTHIGVSLPVASNFATDGQGEGGGGTLIGSSPGNYPLAIASDATNDRISIKFIAQIDSSPITLTFSFTYQII